MKSGIAAGRTGEVVFAILRPNGKVIAVTCDSYPDGIYRIPSGGTDNGEDLNAAVRREAKEELGLDLKEVKHVRTLEIIFTHRGESFLFMSNIFVASEAGGKLMGDATDNEVSGIREIDVVADLNGFEEMVGKLGSIEGEWSDWGKFRQLSSGAVLEYFKDMKGRSK